MTYDGCAADTVTVTAANGYNDHDYTSDVERTAPEDNEPGSVTADGSNVTWADGGYHDEDVAADLAKTDIEIDLEDGQSVEVTVGPIGGRRCCEHDHQHPASEQLDAHLNPALSRVVTAKDRARPVRRAGAISLPPYGAARNAPT